MSDPFISLRWEDFDPQQNCTAAGEFAAYQDTDKILHDFPIVMLYNFVRACAPSHLVSHVSHGQVADWGVSMHTQEGGYDPLHDLIGRILDQCRKEYCESQDWPGNPDVLGIGIYITYGLQATFTTITLLLAYCVFEGRPESHPRFAKLLEVYWSASWYLSLGMSISSSITLFADRGGVHTIFAAMYGLQISSAVVICLSHVVLRVTQQSHVTAIRNNLYLLISVLAPVSVGKENLSRPSAFERDCSSSVSNFPGFMPFFSIALCMILILLTGVVYAFTGGDWDISFVLTPWAFVWMRLSFAWLTQLRTRTESMVGESYTENDWGFGQVLAMTTWIPIFREMYKVLAISKNIRHLIGRLGNRGILAG